MKKNLQEQIRQNLNLKETEELLQIWQTECPEEWNDETFAIIKEILTERLNEIPPQSILLQVKQAMARMEALRETGNSEKAINECNLAIQLMPDFAQAYIYRGEIYEDEGQLEKALADYQKAMLLDPESEDAWFNLKSLEKDFEKDFQKSSAKQHLDQALAYAQNDEPERAIEACERARQSLPNIAPAYNYLGLILEGSGQLESAMQAYLEAIQHNPRFYPARENLANSRLKLEEEMYRQPATENMDEFQGLEIPADAGPVPGWVYMDEKAYLLTGWPGYRNRPGHYGLDPLASDFEEAHTEGVILRSLLDRRFRTRNPLYLLLMTVAGLVCCLPLLLSVVGSLHMNWGLALGLLILTGPSWAVGILLLVNVSLSLFAEQPDGDADNGNAFF